ncbi:MAG: Hsp20/alpha crystallin family protein [Steroidobacteraceae bacterium]|nr:Hsp20/alpha crystallin family protein [Steroidobacteraceae bacterium]MDW8259590.1 Hsp20/alpha crystallin family protein [Gammaproteobacteria bacterium]
MWADACALLERAARLQRSAFALSSATSPQPVWEPPADVFASAPYLQVIVALPGVAAENVSVVLGDDGLRVEAVRDLPLTPAATIRRLEIPYGRFVKNLSLAPGRYRILERRVEQGCLTVLLQRE